MTLVGAGGRSALDGLRRIRLGPVLVAAGVGVAARLLNMPASDTVLLVTVALVLGLVRVSAGAGRSNPWPVARPLEASGTRRDISALTWTFVGRDGRVSEGAVRRLREVASRRLARHGVVVPPDLGVQHRPAEERQADLVRARAMLGERAWRALNSQGGLPSLNDVAHCVDVLERLGGTRAGEVGEADGADGAGDPDRTLAPLPGPVPDRRSDP